MRVQLNIPINPKHLKAVLWSLEKAGEMVGEHFDIVKLPPSECVQAEGTIMEIREQLEREVKESGNVSKS